MGECLPWLPCELIVRTMSSPEISPLLLDLLVCPLTKGSLDYDREKNELVSERAGLAYPIRDGIPIMLPEEARKIEAK